MFSFFNMMFIKKHKSFLYSVVVWSYLLTTHSANSFLNCPNGCECNDETLVVKCDSGSLDVLPIALNPSVQHLIIKSNKIKTIDSSIQFYVELKILDLSNNDLASIPPRTFASQSKLRELNLSYNKIVQIDSKTFDGLVSLETFNLRGNLIAEIKQNTFSSMNKLRQLNLGQNRISYVHPEAFYGINNLKTLYLDDNMLTTIPAAIDFQTKPILAKLYIGANLFSTIEPQTFKNLSALTHLDLHSTGLNNILEDTFTSLQNLSWLDISDNRFEKIPTFSLKPLKNLVSLSIGQNYFDVIDESAFVGLEKLQYLEITNSKRLQRLSNGAFRNNRKIEYLNLSSNIILSNIEDSVFSDMAHLQYLDLKNNDLHTIIEGTFSNNKIRKLDFSGNPLICDCRLLWFRNWLIERNTTHFNISDVICKFPENLRGESLNQIPISFFGCSKVPARIETVFGILLVVTVAALVALILFIYACRTKIREFLINHWGSSTLGHKENEYQKTFSEEDHMVPQPHLIYTPNKNNVHIKEQIPHISTTPIPVTEL